MTEVKVQNITIGGKNHLIFILGPCVIESRQHTLYLAEQLKILSEELNIPLIFKTSFDKANRTSVDSYRGPGLEVGLKILSEVKSQFGLPILTDIHESQQVEPAAEVADMLQIPAFLCRQTDLLLAAGKTGRVINIKKGQFIDPRDMSFIIQKIESTGNKQILLTDRGTSFGYGGLIADVRAIPIMQRTGYPVIFDATHSAQIPGGATTGGNRQYIPHTTRAMVAAGVNGIFMEVHDNPDQAFSDQATQYPLNRLADLIRQLIRIREVVQDSYDD